MEPIHVVFFPDGLVGVEFNFYGPRPSRLGYYLMRMAELNDIPTFDPLRSNVGAQLERLNDLRLFDLKINASYASILKQADADLGAAFDAAKRLGAPEEVEIVLRARKPRAQALLGRLRTAGRNLLARADLRTEASHFIVKGK